MSAGKELDAAEESIKIYLSARSVKPMTYSTLKIGKQEYVVVPLKDFERLQAQGRFVER